MKTLSFLLFAYVLIPSLAVAQGDPEIRLQQLGIVLPKPRQPVANYANWVRTGNLLFTAGHTPGSAATAGKLGKDLNTEQGYNAAKQAGIQLLSTLKAAIGDLNKVKRIIKVLGMVNCTDDFTNQPAVMNGFSDLMVAVFGDKGKHARSAVGLCALPSGAAVEIEMVVEIED